MVIFFYAEFITGLLILIAVHMNIY